MGEVKTKPDFPEKERELWRIFDRKHFEKEIAAAHVSSDEVLKLLDYPAYFDLLQVSLPESRKGILKALQADDLIDKGNAGKWDITNMGAILFARRLSDFTRLKHKAARVVLYRGETKLETVREQEGGSGYACGFEGLIGFVQKFASVERGDGLGTA